MKRIAFLFVSLGLTAFAAQASAATNTLNPGGQLGPDQALVTPDGLYELRMQSDCNLVLYRIQGHGLPKAPVMASNTQGRAQGCILTMQNDGNLVISDNVHRPVWATNTFGHPGANAMIVTDHSGRGHLWVTIADHTIFNW
jgi:hypothetical protein